MFSRFDPNRDRSTFPLASFWTRLDHQLCMYVCMWMSSFCVCVCVCNIYVRESISLSSFPLSNSFVTTISARVTSFVKNFDLRRKKKRHKKVYYVPSSESESCAHASSTISISWGCRMMTCESEAVVAMSLLFWIFWIFFGNSGNSWRNRGWKCIIWCQKQQHAWWWKKREKEKKMEGEEREKEEDGGFVNNVLLLLLQFLLLLLFSLAHPTYEIIW